MIQQKRMAPTVLTQGFLHVLFFGFFVSVGPLGIHVYPGTFHYLFLLL